MSTTKTPTLSDLLGEAIARNDAGNVTAASRKLGVSRPTVYSWLRGGEPKRSQVAKICLYTGHDERTVRDAIWVTAQASQLDAILRPATEGDPGYLTQLVSGVADRGRKWGPVLAAA